MQILDGISFSLDQSKPDPSFTFLTCVDTAAGPLPGPAGLLVTAVAACLTPQTQQGRGQQRAG